MIYIIGMVYWIGIYCHSATNGMPVSDYDTATMGLVIDQTAFIRILFIYRQH